MKTIPLRIVDPPNRAASRSRFLTVMFGLALGMGGSALSANWTLDGRLPEGRLDHGVAEVNGGIFVFGGSIALGGETATSFIYFPGGGPVTPKTRMPQERTAMGFTECAGQVYSIAGHGLVEFPPNWGRTTDVWSYDPATDTWQTKAALGYERDSNSAASVGGYVYTVGGHHEETGHGFSLSLVERLFCAGGGWQGVAPLKQDSTLGSAGGAAGHALGRRSLGVAVAGGKIYAVGGNSYENLYSPDFTGNWFECYDPVTDTWDDTLPPMPTPRRRFAISVWRDRIYTIGGTTPDYVASSAVEYFDLTQRQWFSDTPFPVATEGSRAVTIGDKLYVVGGMDASGNFLDTVYVTSEPDADNDGVPDTSDLCPNTPRGEPVDADGCSCSQRDPGSDVPPVAGSVATAPPQRATVLVKQLQLSATDNCDPDPLIYIGSRATPFVAGPFHNGDRVTIIHGAGLTPSSHTVLNQGIAADIMLNGDPLIWAVDSAGHAATPVRGAND